MGRIIKTFTDESVLEYDDGKFDSWCVYLSRPTKPRYAPLDIQYFADIVKFAAQYSPTLVYQDFVTIYNATAKQIDSTTLQLIHNLAQKYGNDALEIEIIFTIIYAGMVAEQNKQFTKLGKRVKRLGVYQVLFESMTPGQAANFSKGKGWREIAVECEKRGF